MERKLIFVGGKGGVGKTRVSQAIARVHAERGRRTLWCTFIGASESATDADAPTSRPQAMGSRLWHLRVQGATAFEEYAAMKIGASRLTRVFVQNKLIRYLFQAAPGIHELVVLGKVWFESKNYDHVVVDLPSTGYGVAMFQSTVNFMSLFKGGPLQKDASEMLATFRDPSVTGHLVVALPEEMPLREALDLGALLRGLFPENPAEYLVNRRFPRIPEAETAAERETPDDWASPFAKSVEDYCRKRSELETFNLRIWKGLDYAELPYITPDPEKPTEEPARLVARLAEELRSRRYLA